ncbi:glycosyltransferase family 2 protein [Aerococcus sp.]|uniref:glycosyltransferase family 2 protein n=1 Tax=Aerococcus sp. TaxID=1872398 RepID=UPI0025BB1719|nr:glycosyltransferase family 2 protein [Aerococcus sp.]MBR2129303.1 glycosyltransferase family 2 protein [Aerococcus sp.]
MTFQENFISIVTPVYNAERFIGATIESVQQQYYGDWELILVNDQSSDNSQEIIEAYAQGDERIKVINLVENSGAAVARNTGIAAAKGQYIAFIDSDDVWDAEKLNRQIRFMKEGNIAFSYTDFRLVDENGVVLKEKANVPLSLDYTGLLKNTAIACSTVMIDREVVEDFRMPLVRKGQDTATWLQIMRETGVTAYGISTPLNSYRQVAGSISSDRIGALKRTWNTYYNLEKLPLPKAAYYFTSYVVNAILRRI